MHDVDEGESIRDKLRQTEKQITAKTCTENDRETDCDTELYTGHTQRPAATYRKTKAEKRTWNPEDSGTEDFSNVKYLLEVDGLRMLVVDVTGYFDIQDYDSKYTFGKNGQWDQLNSLILCLCRSLVPVLIISLFASLSCLVCYPVRCIASLSLSGLVSLFVVVLSCLPVASVRQFVSLRTRPWRRS